MDARRLDISSLAAIDLCRSNGTRGGEVVGLSCGNVLSAVIAIPGNANEQQGVVLALGRSPKGRTARNIRIHPSGKRFESLGLRFADWGAPNLTKATCLALMTAQVFVHVATLQSLYGTQGG